MTTAEDIAHWLIDQIVANGRRRTYQSGIVRLIRAEYGEEWLYKNANGNPAIDKRILKAFQPLKTPNVIWDSSDQSWRLVDDEELARIREREAIRRERKAEIQRRRAEERDRSQRDHGD